MRKTYVTTMPDHVGAFLEAGRCFARLGMNITRVSYNKAVDSNMLFIDADGSELQHRQAAELLEDCGYLQHRPDNNVVLIEFRIRDLPGMVVRVLEVIRSYGFNISYISSQENATDYQLFKMGLFVEDPDSIRSFLEEIQSMAQVRVIEYNHSEKVYDNSIFYTSFVSELTHAMGLDEKAEQILLINANLAMQTLDEQGLSPYKTFDNISHFSGLLAACRGEHFIPRITEHKLSDSVRLTLIEPPCGSNTAVLRSGEEFLVIDSGYACYRDEMLPILRDIIPDWDERERRLLITHADVDHCGLMGEFTQVLTNSASAESLRLEYEGQDAFREQNPLHKPYIRICKTLTAYTPVVPEKVDVLWQSPEKLTFPLTQIGMLEFGDLEFEVYEGFGGHLAGEILLIEYTSRVAFTGDVFVNLGGMTPQQAEYNRCAPILMTSVDTDPLRCAAERKAVFQRLGAGEWKIFGAHGSMKSYSVSAQK